MTPEYKRVYDKDSFDNWSQAINTLEAWDVLLPDVAKTYRKLSELRNQSAIHFNPETDENDRELALRAITMLSQIIDDQFSAFGPQPWFIANTPGCSFIKKEAEKSPYIQTVYIPRCLLVGPYHKVDVANDGTGFKFVVTDDYRYEERDISDDEFATLYNKNHGYSTEQTT